MSGFECVAKRGCGDGNPSENEGYTKTKEEPQPWAGEDQSDSKTHPCSTVPRKPNETNSWDFTGSGLNTLEQRFALAWDRKLGLDVSFAVGEDKELIQAHCVILGAASNVFAEMFFEQEASNSYFFPDCQPKAFQALIEFIYKRKLVGMPVAETPEFINVGKKFNVPKFLDSIKTSLINSISTENVFEIEKLAIAYNLGCKVISACWKWIQERTDEVLELHLCNLDLDKFVAIVKNEHLAIPEPYLFKHVVKWSEAECSKRNLEPDRRNLRSIAQPLLVWLRFPNLPDSEYPNSELEKFYTKKELCERGSNINQLYSGLPARRPTPAPAVPPQNREVGAAELFRALLPAERRRSMTVERVEKLFKLAQDYVKNSSPERQKLDGVLKALKEEFKF